MHTPEEAWQILLREIRSLPACELPLTAALDRYLAQPLCADRDIPAAERSAMDGFAIMGADLASLPVRLRVIGEIAAGSLSDVQLASGEAVRIFTGANLPPGADTVVPVEQTDLRRFGGPVAATVCISEPVAIGANIFHRGENARAGQPLLAAGSRLGPCQIGVAAACGYGLVRVTRRPTLALLQTGTELLSADEPGAAPHQIRDSNGPMLAATLTAAGFAVARRETVADQRDLTAAAIATAEAEVVILTGGASAGEHDHVAGALRELGAIIHYHGLAIKPGKPQLFATLPDGKLVFGLPGNPLSALVGLHLLVLPALRLLAGCPPAACRPLLHLPLAQAIEPDLKRQRLILARILPGSTTSLEPLSTVGTADMVTAGLADGIILLPPGTEPLPAGAPVAFSPWGLGR